MSQSLGIEVAELESTSGPIQLLKAPGKILQCLGGGQKKFCLLRKVLGQSFVWKLPLTLAEFGTNV